MAIITFSSGEFSGRSVPVPESGITIGRSSKCDLSFADKLISKEHLSIRFEDGAWWVYDLDSSNGTLLNGEDINAAKLGTGDSVRLGDTCFTFSKDGKVPSDEASILSAAKKQQDEYRSEATVVVPGKAAPEGSNQPKEGIQPRQQKTQSPPPVAEDDDLELIKELHTSYTRMKEELASVIIGQSRVIDEVVMAIFSRGHALLVGVPGLAKTLLISTLSHVLDLGFKRIQFTPDLMPSDITGTDVLEENRATGERSFRFVHGPVFTNMLLADEINRTPPKTQAALLEAMQEHRVTVGAESYHLPEPFFVLATQNPIEQEGTYPLPEAQLDRFMFNIVVDYPSAEEEDAIIRQVTGNQETKLAVTLDAGQVLRLQQLVRRVPVGDHVIEYARKLTRATRPRQSEAPDFVKEMVGWGAGPRAGINLIIGAKARAVLQGRYHATTADVTDVALPVLRHRVITTFNAEAAGVTSDEIIRQLIAHIRPDETLDI